MNIIPPIKTPLDLFKEFFDSEKASGFILILITLISVVIANTPIGAQYVHFWHQHIDLSIAGISLDFSIEHWINDGLMTIFFLLIGLEIEREMYIGELSDIRNAILPILAAVGGMLIPGLIHYAFNAGTSTQAGFGIPMATDIAFALGILSLAGKRIPITIKIFLTALAIIDDLGAIVIIAIFYTHDLSFYYLITALALFGILLLMNRFRVNRLAFYLIPGVIMWYCMLQSGVHATIAGVLLAFAIPFKKIDAKNISYKLQHKLHKPVAFMLIPLFALANTAIILPDNILQSLSYNNSLGIMFGLVFGKFIGILLFTSISIWLGFAKLPEETNWRHMSGAALLAGIGFTMSIFITNLAFEDAEIINASKMSILLASIIAAVFGLITFKLAANKMRPEQS